MFICQVSGKVSKPGEKAFKVVVETRPKIYYKEYKDNRTGEIVKKKIGEGSEIVREVTVVEEVYRQMTKGSTND